MGSKVTLNKKRLTKGQVQEYIKNGAFLNKEMTDIFDLEVEDTLIYNLNDGNYLLVFQELGLKGKGDIWPKDHIEKWVDQIKTDKTREHLAIPNNNVGHWNYFSQSKESFENQVDSFVDKLFEKLKLDRIIGDNSYKSLDVISSKLNDIGIRQVETECYDNVVAYIGEVIRHRINGKWVFNYNNNPIYHPLISTQDEQIFYDPITPVWETMVYGQDFDLRETTVSEIRRNQLNKNLQPASLIHLIMQSTKETTLERADF